MTRMRWTVLISGALTMIFFLIGFLLPKRVLVETTTEINRSPEKVLDYLADLRNWREWSQINKSIDPSLQIEYKGAEAGVGAIKKWKGDQLGRGEISITRITEMPVLHYKLKPNDSGFYFDAKFEIEKLSENTSEVRWVMVADLGINPLMRYAGLALEGSLQPEMETSLKKLKSVLEMSK